MTPPAHSEAPAAGPAGQFPDLDRADAELANSLFEYVRFLLDDDAHLTPLGNLNATGRERLRARLTELLQGTAMEETP